MERIGDYPLTLKDAAHKLGITCNAVRRLAAAGKLRAERFGPLKDLRFNDEHIDAFLAKGDPAKAHRQLVQRIKATEPHYQGLMDLR